MLANEMLMHFRRHGASNFQDGLCFLVVNLEVVHLEHLEDYSYFIHAMLELSIGIVDPTQVGIIHGD